MPPAVRSGTVLTVTVALWFAVPPEPVQVTLYVVLVFGETETVPAVALPVEKLAPVHEVAFVEDHVIVELEPKAIDDGDAEIVAVGAGVAETITVFDEDLFVVGGSLL